MKRDEDSRSNDDEKEDSADDGEKDTSNPLLYNQEQKELRSAFLESTLDGNDDGSDDWMVLKKRAKPTNDDETDKLIQQELEALEKTTSDGTLKDPRGEVEDGEKFLLDFIKNKKWIDKEQESSSDDEDERKRATGIHDSDDDSIEEVDRADDFESNYNFRFEQAEAEASKSGADFSVIGYARSGTMNTLRRKDETRKQKRLERKERKAAERKAKEEQLRRLKNAKREEMEQKLKQIKSVLGYVEGSGMTVDEAAMMKLMEGDYDPEKFEEIMNEAYGDDFYQQQDAEWKTDRDVRETLLRDEEDGKLIAGLDDEAGGLYDNVEEDDDEEEDYGDNIEGDGTDQNEEWDEEEHYNEGDNGNQEETEMERKLREKMKEELYKLDYEDIVAGIPTRFKYRSVPKNNYGLSTEEILFAKDTSLKSFVSLKKMAPYREDVCFDTLM
jgi:protein KRI1